MTDRNEENHAADPIDHVDHADNASGGMTAEDGGDGTARRRRGTRGGRGRSRSGAAGAAESTSGGVAKSTSGADTTDLPIAARRPGRVTAAAQTVTPTATAAPAASAPPAAIPAASATEVSATQAAPVVAARATPRARVSAGTPPLSGDIAEIARAVDQMRAAIEQLGAQVERATRRRRLAVFVDVPNLLYGADHVEQLVDMGRLLDVLSEGRELVRATAYAPISDAPNEPLEQQKFVAPFMPHSRYRIVTKSLKRFQDGSIKGNFDVEMAIDMVTMADRLDVACVVSGDSDFSKAVEVLQERGVRVEVVAFAGSASTEMRALADEFIEVGGMLDRLRPLRPTR